MKIAICFSGQPRTWEKCIDQWDRLMSALRERHDADIDIFMHAWKSNTQPHATICADNNPKFYMLDYGTPIPDNDLIRLMSRLNPKSVLLEDTSLGISKVQETLDLNGRHNIHHGDAVISWAAPQFYSIMRAAHLKKKYEFEQGFRYDACIRMRYDLYFDDRQLEYFTKLDFKQPVVNTIYPCHTSIDDSLFPYFRMGDILWYADSVAFDRISDIYRWFPILGKKSFGRVDVSPEHALYLYTKMLKMQVVPLMVDPKIFRPTDYLQHKLDAGLPAELGKHELI